MSALGQKQTFCDAEVMSALSAKADSVGRLKFLAVELPSQYPRRHYRRAVPGQQMLFPTIGSRHGQNPVHH